MGGGGTLAGLPQIGSAIAGQFGGYLAGFPLSRGNLGAILLLWGAANLGPNFGNLGPRLAKDCV